MGGRELECTQGVGNRLDDTFYVLIDLGHPKPQHAKADLPTRRAWRTYDFLGISGPRGPGSLGAGFRGLELGQVHKMTDLVPGDAVCERSHAPA